jgi:ankyrin repeat protein
MRGAGWLSNAATKAKNMSANAYQSAKSASASAYQSAKNVSAKAAEAAKNSKTLQSASAYASQKYAALKEGANKLIDSAKKQANTMQLNGILSNYSGATAKASDEGITKELGEGVYLDKVETLKDDVKLTFFSKEALVALNSEAVAQKLDSLSLKLNAAMASAKTADELVAEGETVTPTSGDVDYTSQISALLNETPGSNDALYRLDDGEAIIHKVCTNGTEANLDFLLGDAYLAGNASLANESGETPLMLCAKYRDEKFVGKFLNNQAVKNKISLDVKDSTGKTALHHAAAKGNLAVLQLIAPIVHDVVAKDNDGNTPLLLACTNSDTSSVADSVCHLIDESRKKDPNAVNITNNEQRNALYYVSQPIMGGTTLDAGVTKIMDSMLCASTQGTAGCATTDIQKTLNNQDKDGKTVLFAAVDRGITSSPNSELVKYLISHGADTSYGLKTAAWGGYGYDTRPHDVVGKYIAELTALQQSPEFITKTQGEKDEIANILKGYNDALAALGVKKGGKRNTRRRG